MQGWELRFLSLSPPPTQPSLPFCAGIQFSKILSGIQWLKKYIKLKGSLSLSLTTWFCTTFIKTNHTQVSRYKFSWSFAILKTKKMHLNKYSHCILNNHLSIYLMPCKSIKLRYTITQRTISVNNPDFWFWTTELGPQGKASTHPQGTKCSWIQPCQGTTWPENREG